MKKRLLLRVSPYILGTVLIASSCVKTEELESVKQIREAKAASLLATANSTDADTKYKLAETASLNFKRWCDSTNYVQNSAVRAADVQTALEQANYELAQAKARTLQQQQQLSELQNSNPVLAALISDYNAYYNGGGLSNNAGYINEGIYNLRSDILNMQSEITKDQTLKANGIQSSDISNLTQNNPSYWNILLIQDSADLKANQATLKLYQSAKSDGISTALTTAKAQAATALADFTTKNATYQNAYNAWQIALAVSNSSYTAYSAAQNDSIAAQSNFRTALNTYNEQNPNSKITINYTNYNNGGNADNSTQIPLLISNQTSIVQKELDLVTAITNTYNDTLTVLNNVTATYNTAKSKYDIANINGSVPTSDPLYIAWQNALARFTLTTGNYNTIQSNLNTKKLKYSTDLTNLNLWKSYWDKYNTTIAQLPALRTDYNTKKADTDTKQKAELAAQAASNIAYSIYTAILSAISNINNLSIGTTNVTYGNLDEYITERTNFITENIASIKYDIAQIAILKSSNVDYDAQIKLLTDKIAGYTALIATYTAKAAAIKTKIDAQ